MAQLERRKESSESQKSPRSQSQTSPSFEQILRVEDPYWSTNASPGVRACHEHAECPSPCPSQVKKSVLAKVKERAKKLKCSLSGRRKQIEVHDNEVYDHSHDQNHNHGHNLSHEAHDHNNNHNHGHDHYYDHHHDHVTPCWTATLEDEYLNEKDYDPEYLGAPMYESEAAPECLKETARQHPRAVPVVSECHRAPTMAKQEAALHENENKPASPNTTTTATKHEATPRGNDNKPATPNMYTTPTPTTTPTYHEALLHEYDNNPVSPYANMIAAKTNREASPQGTNSPYANMMATKTNREATPQGMNSPNANMITTPTNHEAILHEYDNKPVSPNTNMITTKTNREATPQGTNNPNTNTFTAKTNHKGVPEGTNNSPNTNMITTEAVPQVIESKPVSPSTSMVTTVVKHEAIPQENDNKSNMITNVTQTVSDKLAPACAAVSNATHNMTETVSDKLAPAHEAVSNATHQINRDTITNIPGAVSEKLAPACNAVSNATHNVTGTVSNATHNVTGAVSEKLAPAREAVSNATHQINRDTITNIPGAVSEKLAPAYNAVSNATHNVTGTVSNATHNVTGTSNVSDKLTPACAAVSDATHQIASKLAGITVTSPKARERAQETSSEDIVAFSEAEVKIINEDEGNLKQCTGGSPQTWDKGVSVKEYFLNKLEPGEDERALSQAITEAISPRKSTGDAGVVDKVKGAVTSLFRQEESSNSPPKSQGSPSATLATSEVTKTVQLNRVHIQEPKSPYRAAPASAPAVSSVEPTPQLNRMASAHYRSSKLLNTDSNTSSSVIRLTNNDLEVYEEENHGKILQTN